MKQSCLAVLLAVLITHSGCAQNTGHHQQQPGSLKDVGGPCEGCEAIYENPVPFEDMNAVDTLPDFTQAGPKLVITGIVYQRDGITPAPGVVLYIYHTDQGGRYTATADAKGWEKRHGAIRGWVKTNQHGFYKFYTLVPASYPNSRNPKHIHPVIKEPGFKEYYIDEFLFADDPLLPGEEKNKQQPRGGNGVLKTIWADGLLIATRNIILGLNVPGYPTKQPVPSP